MLNILPQGVKRENYRLCSCMNVEHFPFNGNYIPWVTQLIKMSFLLIWSLTRKAATSIAELQFNQRRNAVERLETTGKWEWKKLRLNGHWTCHTHSSARDDPRASEIRNRLVIMANTVRSMLPSFFRPLRLRMPRGAGERTDVLRRSDWSGPTFPVRNN